AHSILPVIGVPIDSSALKGLDALLSPVQMPPGVPVATVSIGKPGATNAAVPAAQTIAVGDEPTAPVLRAEMSAVAAEAMAKKLHDDKKKLASKVEAAAAKLNQP